MIDLGRARILISNDDGIRATGLKVLEEIARCLSDDVWVVAPEHEQSGAGHSLTLRRPLRMRAVDKYANRYTVDGTPTDCVMLAVKLLMQDKRPDLVLSGVNKGANLGEDMTYSGTIAAAMEGTLLGIPSIALSLRYEDPDPPKWETARAHGPEVIRRAVAVDWPANCLINVNFPDVAPEQVTGVEVTVEGRRKIGDHIQRGVDPRGLEYFWIGAQREEDRYAAGTDLEAVCRGAISVTPLDMDLTHRAGVELLRGHFG